MKTKSILIPAAALIAGSVAGWFTGESPRAAAARASAPPSVVAPPLPENAAQQRSTPAVKPCSFDALYDHLLWLESATVAQVAVELWAPGANNDPIMRALTASRFLRFAARERLDALLAIKQGTRRNYFGEEMAWLTPTLAEMLAEAPEDVARLFSNARLQPDPAGLLDKLFASQGYDGCLDFISKLPEQEQQRLRGAAVSLLAKQDLARAQAESLKAPEGAARNEMISAVAAVWAGSDPRAALAWAAQHGREKENSMGGRSSHPARSLLADLMLKDPKLGGELLLENQSLYTGSYGPYTLGQIFEVWVAKDYTAAAEWLAAHPLSDDLHATAARAVHSTRLQSLKGEEALQFYQTLPDEIKGDCSRALVLAVGVDGLPGGLVSFTESLSESDQSSFLSRLCNIEHRLTPEQIKSILPLAAKRDISGYTTSSLIQQLPEADLAAMRSLLPEKLRAEVSIHAAEKAMESGDLETAKTLLTTAEGRDTLRHAQLAIKLAQDNPNDATAWIDSLKDGQAKQDAITNLAANWAKADLAAATTWVEQLPPGKARDEAVREITRLQGLSGDTAAALALAATVKSESARLTAFANAARHAWFHDAAGTSAQIAAQGLTAEQQKKVIAAIQTGSIR